MRRLIPGYPGHKIELWQIQWLEFSSFLVFIAASIGHNLNFKKDILVLLMIFIQKSPKGIWFPKER